MKTCCELRFRQTPHHFCRNPREQCLALNKVCGLFTDHLIPPELDLYANIALCVCRYKHGKAIYSRTCRTSNKELSEVCV